MSAEIYCKRHEEFGERISKLEGQLSVLLKIDVLSNIALIATIVTMFLLLR